MTRLFASTTTSKRNSLLSDPGKFKSVKLRTKNALNNDMFTGSIVPPRYFLVPSYEALKGMIAEVVKKYPLRVEKATKEEKEKGKDRDKERDPDKRDGGGSPLMPGSPALGPERAWQIMVVQKSRDSTLFCSHTSNHYTTQGVWLPASYYSP
eukprot:TRINITY_DN13647_c0_g1_i1.p1 TRINITY_DN13647_c0_g1~~TRINITY_DN13647_c0_g1_i1.p1  ORF type:complete len:152 (+),score=14.73 TRINITY_DN13647_c0_g1_i1:332-787(+)